MTPAMRRTAAVRPLVYCSTAVLLAALLAVSADAYVRSRTSKDNTPLFWQGNCAYLTPDSAGTPDVSAEALDQAIRASAAAWNAPSCSYFELKVDARAPGGAAEMNRPTGKNTIVFRQDSWCPPDPEEPCYDPNATALTTVFYIDKPGDPENGRILDADVELNNVNFAFTVDGTRPPGSLGKTLADIQNTLTHELGHLLGLDHTCYDGWNPCEGNVCKATHTSCQSEEDCIPLDDKGARIPRCGGPLPAEVVEATMYNYAASLETAKRTLAQDDIEGICGIYPVAQDPGVCERVKTGGGGDGCAAAPAAAARPGAAVLLAFLLCVGALRRRRVAPVRRSKSRSAAR